MSKQSAEINRLKEVIQSEALKNCKKREKLHLKVVALRNNTIEEAEKHKVLINHAIKQHQIVSNDLGKVEKELIMLRNKFVDLVKNRDGYRFCAIMFGILTYMFILRHVYKMFIE